MKKQGIIFDMDGTLWDSAANVAESWNEAIRQDGSSGFFVSHGFCVDVDV